MGSRKRVLALALIMVFSFPLMSPVISASADGESWLPGVIEFEFKCINRT